LSANCALLQDHACGGLAALTKGTAMRFSHIPAALAVLLAAGVVAAIAGCASTTSPVASTVASRHSEAAVSPSQPAATSPAPAASSPTPAPSGVSNLVVPDPVRSELTAAYVAYMHFNPANIAGTTPRSVYYAYDATTGTYWAMATFQPTKAALGSKPGSPAFNMLVNMQDGGSTGLFSRASAAPGRYRTTAGHRSARSSSSSRRQSRPCGRCKPHRPQACTAQRDRYGGSAWPTVTEVPAPVEVASRSRLRRVRLRLRPW
jgi:hypothetical protein